MTGRSAWSSRTGSRWWARRVKAPSIHNTQPWRFTASAERVELHFDRERALPVLDPSGRQQVISCGIAVEFAVVALAARGLAAEVDLLPDGDASDHLATVRVTGAHDTSDDDRSLAEAIDRRHTVRAPFLPQAVPGDLVDALQREAARFDTWCKPITRSEEEVATVFLISRAEEMEQGDPAYVAELQSWMRTDPGAVDGVPVEAVPSGDPRERPSNWLIRDFVVGQRESPRVPLAQATRTHRRRTSSGRRSCSWARPATTGPRGCSPAAPWPACCCEATAAGLAASPLTQALDWPDTRTRMQQRLSLIGYPQFLLRMGYPASDRRQR